MLRDACRPQESITVQNSEQNNPDLMTKQRLPQLSNCHLAVSLSYASYHTSSERGDSGLPADIKIRTNVQLIGFLWSYFGIHLGSNNHAQHFDLSLCNPLKHIRLPYTRWKGTFIAFILGMEASPPPRGYRDMAPFALLMTPASYYVNINLGRHRFRAAQKGGIISQLRLLMTSGEVAWHRANGTPTYQPHVWHDFSFDFTNWV